MVKLSGSLFFTALLVAPAISHRFSDYDEEFSRDFEPLDSEELGARSIYNDELLESREPVFGVGEALMAASLVQPLAKPVFNKIRDKARQWRSSRQGGPRARNLPDDFEELVLRELLDAYLNGLD
ncbi:hypothetical protein FA15DRAFT_652950 [Coprinopsis marcescibilis]|uniref:Uncharacterized protein n=1 Tax=Coprinopsis marcescibilis TaxID=230819 RepID=A0A5C3L5I1_COPMA|nr:hypothetical protein FA15DRAFT_652950 [Coprinopsis marcescibilis]